MEEIFKNARKKKDEEKLEKKTYDIQKIMCVLLTVIAICSIIFVISFLVFAIKSNSAVSLLHEVIRTEKEINERMYVSTERLHSMVSDSRDFMENHLLFFDLFNEVMRNLENEYNSYKKNETSSEIYMFFKNIPVLLKVLRELEIVDSLNDLFGSIKNTSDTTRRLEERILNRGKFEINF